VSRHLKILGEARLVSHFRDGQWVYYRLDPVQATSALVEGLIDLARSRDEAVAADAARMDEVRQRRERYALTAPTGPRRWVEPAAERPGEPALAAALVDALGEGPLGDVLDVGVGSGALLRLLTPRATSAVGLDLSKGMRVLARSRLQGTGAGRWTIRAGDMHAIPFPDHSFDVVVLDEVLSLTAEPQAALAEAARVLRPAGRLLVLDRILPAALRLSSDGPRHRLFENQLGAMIRGTGLRAGLPVWFPGRTPDYALISAAAAASRRRTGTDE
jgi:SAM-dependent methyltransferase